jgi:hypothetical protein
MTKRSSQSDLFRDFSNKNAAPDKKAKPKTVPVSIRVTEEEKAYLEQLAGSLALAHYIRLQMLGDMARERPKQYQKKQRQPKIDDVEIARLLGMFGKSELATSMLALSLAAQSGDLDVSEDVESKLERACDDIHEIKIALIMALGIKPQGESG